MASAILLAGPGLLPRLGTAARHPSSNRLALNDEHALNDEGHAAVSETLSVAGLGFLRQVTDPIALLQRVADGLLDLEPIADGAVVELVDESGDLFYAAAAGSLAAHVGARIALKGSLSGLALRTRSVLHCDDVTSDLRVDPLVCERFGIRSMLVAPLLRGDEPIGAVKIVAREPGAFGAIDMAMAEALAGALAALVGGAAEVAQAAEALVRLVRCRSAAAGGPDAREATAAGGLDGGGLHPITVFMSDLIRPGAAAAEAMRCEIAGVLERRAITMVFQPVVSLATGSVVGMESLARFVDPPGRSPDRWFVEAHRVGLGAALELAAVEAALALFDQLPGSTLLAVNASPAVLASAELAELVLRREPARTVVELTEHVAVVDYSDLNRAIADLRAHGVKLSVDDAGAGFASLSHIVKLAPDYIKLDRELVHGIDVDPVRQALGQALVAFAHSTGAQVAAEGIETADELATVKQLGMDYGQGFHLGRPGPLSEVLAYCAARARG